MAARIRSRVVRDVGRWRSRAALLRHPGFDPAWYSLLRGSVLTRRDAVQDYLRAGRGQGWSPHPLFDHDYYVARGGQHRMLMESFAGYVSDPARRHRPTHALLDVQAYLVAHPEAEAYPGGPIEHYLKVTDRQLRDRLVEHAGGWARRRHLARANRLTSHFDAAAAQLFVASYAGVVPDPGSEPVTVSVVLPVWNRAAQVGAAIDSVQAQTLTDWELIVVDDGSTDDLETALSGYAGDQRIVVVRRPHEGVSAARNAGLAAARGRYVAWLDSDDTWTVEHLRVMTAFMQRQGHRAAYDVLELRRPGRPPGFRTLDVGRITRSHPATWIDVVLNRDTLGWSAAPAVRSPVGGTVVVVAPTEHTRLCATVEDLLASTEGTGAQILVVDNGLELMASQVLASLAWTHRRLGVVAAPSDRGWAVAVNQGLLASGSDRVVLVDSAVRTEPGWLPPLLSALESAGVAGAQPGAGEPSASHAAMRDIPALSWGACAVRVSDLVPLFGLDPLIRPELAMADLSLRLAASTGGRFVATGSAGVHLAADLPAPHSRHPELDSASADAEGREVFAARWGRAALSLAVSQVGGLPR